MMRSETTPSTAVLPPPPPPPKADFRTAVIKNHWNDAPKKTFKATTNDIDEELDVSYINSVITKSLEQCQVEFNSGTNKRIVEDTNKRMDTFLGQLEQEDASHVIAALGLLCKGLESKDFTKAVEIHRQLMTTEYEKYGNGLLGLKRLIDLSTKIAA